MDEHEAVFDGAGRLLVDKARRQRQQESARRPPELSRVGRFRALLTSDEVAAFEAVAGPLLRSLGYSS